MWNAYRFLFLNLRNIEVPNLQIKDSELSEIESYYFFEFNKALKEATKHFDGYNWHEAFIVLRVFFWNELCDNYIEAIKHKFYSEDKSIAQNALKNALSLFYKILTTFAFTMPFITEEIYSILYQNYIALKSIHLEAWPQPYDNVSEELAKRGKLAIEIIKILRNCKSKLKIPLNQEVERIIISTDKNTINEIENVKADIINTIRIKNFEIIETKKEKDIKESPELKEDYEDLNLSLFFFK
jgi:valyl-tRNA synthetase